MAVVIDPTHVALMRGAVSIHVASRSAANVASVARAVGCRIADDLSNVAVFLPAAQAHDVLADVRACGQIAVVFSRPSTHRTIQLKGDDGRVVPLRPGDPGRVADYADAFVGEIAGLGYPADLGRALLAVEAGDLVAVEFTPDAAFRQTPGPDAGARLTG
jgi:hypothetical protein